MNPFNSAMFGSAAHAPQLSGASESATSRLIASNSFALVGAITLGVLAPELVYPWAASVWSTSQAVLILGLRASFFGSIVAILIGHNSLSRFTSLPTIDATTYVVPSFLIGYATVLALLYVTSSSFGHYHFLISFAIVVPWYLTLAVARNRLVKPHVAIVGTEQHQITAALNNVQWTMLDSPVLTHPVSAIVVDSHHDLSPEWEHFIAQAVLQGIPVYDAPHMRETLSRRVEITHMAHNNFGALLPALTYIRVKRVLDLILAIPALIVTAPVILLFCVLVRLDSPGPAIFTQQRIGFRGVPFTFYKIRSMVMDHGGASFTDAGDPRITRIGAFIRKYRIDELPQIWNIVKGDMSWIGPRPEAVPLAQLYEASIPYYVYRHAVRPGISGWAAVHQGNVAEVDAATIKLQYDFFYIKYHSLWLDILITLMTIRTILTGFGSR